MRLTVVREQLEDRELANYTPMVALGATVDVVTSRRAGPYSASGLDLPVTRLRRLVDHMGPPVVSRRVRRVVEPRFRPDDLHGFDQVVARTDVVCVNETHIASSAQACRSKRDHPGMRVVAVCYENIPFRYEDDARLAARKDTVRQLADGFVALTPEAQHALELEGVDASRIALQPYGVDPERFSPANRDDELRRSWIRQPDDLVALFAGRLIPEKGLNNLLLAVAEHAPPNLRVVLVGSGGEEPRLRRMVGRLGLEDRVAIDPWVAADAVPRVMASADLFVMPSLPTPYWEEQLGFSLIEAMASGVPVVSTASGSIPFVVGDGGRCVPPYDVAALGRTIRDLADDGASRREVGDAGRRRVEESLNTQVAARELLTIMETIGT
jgi:glycosyltransferase involved in cell wall biosynthesis